MRRVALVVACAVLVAACGDAGDPAQPAAATSTIVQPATPPPPADAARSSGSAAARDDASVLRGDYKRLNGERENLGTYRGKVVLVVNTATECGYTPQFEGLEALYRARRDDGLVVLGFPANDFAGQEPRSDEEIATFCKANYGVTFPMFSKTRVVGSAANPLYRTLTAAAGAPDWNFTKYLLDRRGRVVARYGAGTEPTAPELTERLGKLLAVRA